MEANLDVLAVQIERAAGALARLKDDNRRLELELKAYESRLDGKSFDALVEELEGLRTAEKSWSAERKEVANRIEELAKKLERLEA